ncbi:MAG: site-specific DNA-methyltransferase [Candidatus Competibacter sp.]|nr:site-specific DNA-methyltransferase [Candidatus Competibacter sp.]MDG4585124.1 site-specific DNA-methyltransferase [Candidatus Competibacter sp.]
MSQPQAETRFIELMAELFQTDEAEALDFGWYRVIRRHNREVRAFLGEIVAEHGWKALKGGRLSVLLAEAFREAEAETAAEDRHRLAALEKQLGLKPGANAVERDQRLAALEMVPATMELVNEYRAILERKTAASTAALDRSEVFNRLYQFFSRHYQDGDFIVARRYGREGSRYLRSTGEDTEFHWATEGMYYIKSGDVFTDFPVRLAQGQRLLFTVEPETLAATRAALKPNDKAHYELASVCSSGEIPPSPPFAKGGTEQPQPGVRKETRVCLKYLKGARSERHKDEIVNAVQRECGGDGTEIRRWLNQFIARNQNDFFIHQRLGPVLREDLDIFIKTEMLDADQLLAGGDLPQRVLRVARIVREVGQQIIAFLAALADFQKTLWEKKKLVFSTRYVITLDRIDRLAGRQWLEARLEPIVRRQREEWRTLGLGDFADAAACRMEKSGDLITEATHRYLPLPVDTGHFDEEFKWALLEAVTRERPLDEALDGLALHSDNWQALHLLRAKYRERVKCIYIDPPYNTGGDGFPYKDAYQHASWLAMIDERLSIAKSLMDQQAALFVSLDDHEQPAFRLLADRLYGSANFIATVIWQKIYSPKNSAKHFSEDHDYLLVYARNAERWLPELLPRTAEMEARYGSPDNDPRGPWKPGDLSARNPYSQGRYPITCPSGRLIPGPPPGTYWRVSKTKFEELDRDGRIWWGENRDNIPAIKRFLSEVKQGRVPQTIWLYQEVGHTQDAKKELLAYTPLAENESVFQTPKPTALIRRVLSLSTEAISADEWVLDFFAGSGTTGHAVIAQNHADDGQRKFLLVECNAYFDTLLLPRLKRAAWSPEWKENGKTDGPGLFLRVQTLEQYDDTLANLAIEPETGQSADFDFDGPAFSLRYRLHRESQALYCAVEWFASPFGYTLKRVAGGGEAPSQPVDLVESLIYLLGLDVTRLYREPPGAVILGHDRREQTVAVFFRDCAHPEAVAWLQAQLAAHSADRIFTNDPAALTFEGCERFESIEAVFAGQFGPF